MKKNEKPKFSGIKKMLSRDEMKQIVAGYGCGGQWDLCGPKNPLTPCCAFYHCTVDDYCQPV